ncbi:MAG: NAD-dependent epimerase/dehydratase family protein, partial [Chloroflexota bacterium]
FLFEGHPFAADTRKGRAAVKLESMLADARRERGLAYSIVRLPNVYGPQVQSALYRSVFENAIAGKALTWYGSLDTPLELVYVADAARALLQVGLDTGTNGRAFNLPGPEVTTARKWLTLLAGLAGTRAHPRAIPSPIIAIAGWFNHEAHEMHELLYLKTRRLILEGHRYAGRYGSYPATPYAEGIAATLDWYRAGCPPLPHLELAMDATVATP